VGRDGGFDARVGDSRSRARWHNTSIALAVSEQANVLERGRVAFNGPAQTLRERPDILHSSYLAT